MRSIGAALLGVLALLIGTTAVLLSSATVGAGVDETPPVVELVAPDEGAVVDAAEFVEVACVATDNTKVDGQCIVDFIEERSETGLDIVVTATASDRRGNTTSVSSTFSLLFDAVGPAVVDDRAIGLVGGGTLSIDVTANDYDADDNLDLSTLTLTSQARSGEAAIDREHGVVLYEPAGVGGDSFGYQICDAEGACDTGSVEVMLLDDADCTVVGTPGDDELTGTRADDVICGYGGNDVINGRAGNDIVFAGPGDDVVIGGPGGDVLLGEAGNDSIRGGAQTDYLDGGTGDDLLKGENQSDVVIGNVGNDELHGGRGDDVLAGGAGDDRAFGWAGHDHVIGGAGDDIVRGGGGADELRAGPGDDFLHGEGGDDILIGGEGFDTGDAGKQLDECASLERRLRCDGYGVSTEGPTAQSTVPTVPELPPAEHDADDEVVDELVEEPPPISS